MKEKIDIAHANRWARLDDYRATFDRALAEVRAATERADDTHADWVGPAKARQEIAEAREQAEHDYGLLAARRAADG